MQMPLTKIMNILELVRRCICSIVPKKHLKFHFWLWWGQWFLYEFREHNTFMLKTVIKNSRQRKGNKEPQTFLKTWAWSDPCNHQMSITGVENHRKWARVGPASLQVRPPLIMWFNSCRQRERHNDYLSCLYSLSFLHNFPFLLDTGFRLVPTSPGLVSTYQTGRRN